MTLPAFPIVSPPGLLDLRHSLRPGWVIRGESSGFSGVEGTLLVTEIILFQIFR